jgi:hypothetical protein
VWDDINYGTVIFHSDFVFNDGDRSPKLILVIGWHEECATTLLITSRPPPTDVGYGCHSDRNLYKVRSLPTNCLDKDTYVQLARFGDLKPAMANHQGWISKAKVIGKLPEQTTNEIKNCALYTKDISDRRKKQLGLKRPPPKPGANKAVQTKA